MQADDRHVVAVPYPGRGHINPMICLCRHLASRGGLLVTFVVTEEWHSLLSASDASLPPLPPGFRFRTIPNSIPSEKVRATDFVGFLEAVYTKMEAPFELLLDGFDRPPVVILADMYLPWVVEVGRRRNISVASLVTMSATFFNVLYHYSDLAVAGSGSTSARKPAANSNGLSAKEEDNFLEQFCIPDVQSSLRLSDFDSVISQQKLLQLVLEAFSWLRRAQVLLFTSFYELEPRIFDALRSEIQCHIYAVGPCIPYMMLPIQKSLLANPNVVDCYNWLDCQTESSVLYVSLGSFLSVSASQLEEIAMGLVASGIKFLWVARDNTSRMQTLMDKAMGSGKVVVVPWCDQLRVLCHPSVGGFLTHCGWNSTLEAVFAGVPLITFPIFFDQPPNSRIIVEEWKIGLSLREKEGDAGIVCREDITAMVGKLMDMNESESKEVRKRAKNLKMAALRAIAEEGSSLTALNSFLKFIFA